MTSIYLNHISSRIFIRQNIFFEHISWCCKFSNDSDTFYWKYFSHGFNSIFIFFGLCCDVMIALGGYIFSSKFLGTESSSVDETWQGWLVCLICYYLSLIYIRHLSANKQIIIFGQDWLQPDSFILDLGIFNLFYLVYHIG